MLGLFMLNIYHTAETIRDKKLGEVQGHVTADFMTLEVVEINQCKSVCIIKILLTWFKIN